MFLLLIISSFSVTSALQWTSSPTFPNGTRLDVCAGAIVTLPWAFQITTSEHVHYVKWFTSLQNESHSQILLAVNTSEQFILSNKGGPSINFLPNAGLQLFGSGGIHSGYYSVHVYLGDTCNMFTQTAYVHVSEAPVTIDDSLHAVLSDDRVYQPRTGEWNVQLECGKFLSLGHPPVNVIWKMPSNKTVPSNFHNNSTFFLTLPNPLNNGRYSCQLDGTSPAVQCLQSDSLKTHIAVVTVDGFEKRLSTLEGRLEALQEETVNMHGPVSEMTDAINSSQTEVKFLLGEISRIRENNDNLTGQVRELQSLIDRVEDHFRMYSIGSTYTKWGSDNCSGSADTVYSGFIGGSFYNNTGGAANYLCLPLIPIYDQHLKPSTVTLLYGGEYSTYPKSTHNYDPICAVCRTPHSTNIMIPATNTCALGWTLEYSGYLMAGLNTHNSATEYICVDSSFKYVANSQADHNGKMLFYTVSACGMQCPKYSDGNIITCVVCSK